MGCSYSAAAGDGSEGACHTFRVYNVDSQGIELNPGKIQVAASDLILYQRGKEPILWPLRCLRRYGFDAELFSFESGRRCPTGPGIYAFKCRHAEELFNMVQDSIQRAGQEDQLRVSGDRGVAGGDRGVAGGDRGGAGGAHGHFSPRPSSQPAAASLVDQDQYGFMLGSSRLLPPCNPPSAHHHLYVNGGPGGSDPGHQYINTGIPRTCPGGAFMIDESAPLIHFMKRAGPHGGPGVRGQVNYAVLDLPSSMENLLDEEGQGPVHNMPRISTRSRHSVPPDLSAALGPDDLGLGFGDFEVFLAEPEGSAPCPTYINVSVDDDPPPSPPSLSLPCAEAAGGSTAGGSSGAGVAATPGGAGGLSVDRRAGSTPNYANLTMHSSPARPGLSGRPFKPPGINYIQLDLNQPTSDPSSSSSSSAATTTAPAPACNMSPTSPTSLVSVPESPGYAMIDFNKTEALSHSTRAGTDGEDEPGARKTRHNSTIGT